jgi:general stress protein YciG
VTKPPSIVRQYLSDIGRKGGQQGRGKPKKRPTGYYSKIGKLGGKAKKGAT